MTRPYATLDPTVLNYPPNALLESAIRSALVENEMIEAGRRGTSAAHRSGKHACSALV